MKHICLLFIFLISILSSCQQNKTSINIKHSADYSVQFDDLRNTNLGLAKLAHLVTDSTILLYYYDHESHNLIIRDILHPSFKEKIDLNPIIDRTNIESFFLPTILSRDSILLISKDNVILFESKGTVITEEKIEKTERYKLYSNSFTPCIYNNGYVYCKKYYTEIPLIDERSLLELFSKSIDIGFSINNTLIDSQFNIGVFPTEYTRTFYYDFFPTRCVNNLGQLIYSFGADNNLYIFDKDNFNKKVAAKSKFYAKPSAFPLDKIRDLGFVRKYTTTEFKYLSIVYDPYYNRYYRLVKHHTKFLTNKGTIKKPIEAPWSIMILDENFQLLDEIIMDPLKYSYGKIIPTKLGLLIANQPLPNSKEITFSLFDLPL